MAKQADSKALNFAVKAYLQDQSDKNLTEVSRHLHPVIAAISLSKFPEIDDVLRDDVEGKVLEKSLGALTTGQYEDRGIQFSTYLTTIIRNEMINAKSKGS